MLALARLALLADPCSAAQYTAPNGACLDQCDWPYHYVNEDSKTCTSSCPTHSYKIVQVSEDVSKYVCDPCGGLNVSYDKEVGDSYEAQCIAGACPPLFFFIKKGDNGAGLPTGQCTPYCLTKKYPFTDDQLMICKDKCESGYYLVNLTIKQCLPSDACPATFNRKMDDGTNHFVCLPTCGASQPFLTSDGDCAAKCPPIAGVYEFKCLLQCPASAKYTQLDTTVGDQMCVSKCDSTYFTEVIANHRWKCTQCDLSVNYSQEMDDGMKLCTPACVGAFHNKNHTCVAKCDNWNDATSMECVDECKAELFRIDANKTCVARCPAHYFTIDDSTCAESCGSGYMADFEKMTCLKDHTSLYIAVGCSAGVAGLLLVAFIIIYIRKSGLCKRKYQPIARDLVTYG